MGTCCSVEEGSATSKDQRQIAEKSRTTQKLKKYETTSSSVSATTATLERTPGAEGQQEEEDDDDEDSTPHGGSSFEIPPAVAQQQEGGGRGDFSPVHDEDDGGRQGRKYNNSSSKKNIIDNSKNIDGSTPLPLLGNSNTTSANTHGVTRETSRQSSYTTTHDSTTNTTSLPPSERVGVVVTTTPPQYDAQQQRQQPSILGAGAEMLHSQHSSYDNNSNSVNRSSGGTRGGGGSNSSAILGLSGNSPLISLDAGSSTTNGHRGGVVGMGLVVGSGTQEHIALSISGVNPSTVGYLPEPQVRGMQQVLVESNLPREQRFLDMTQQQQMLFANGGGGAAAGIGGGQPPASATSNQAQQQQPHPMAQTTATTTNSSKKNNRIAPAVLGADSSTLLGGDTSINNLSLGRDAGLHSVGYIRAEPSHKELQERIQSVALRNELMEAMESSAEQDDYAAGGDDPDAMNHDAAADGPAIILAARGGMQQQQTVTATSRNADLLPLEVDDDGDAAGFVSSGRSGTVGGGMYIREEDQVLSSDDGGEEQHHLGRGVTGTIIIGGQAHRGSTLRNFGLTEDSPALIGNHFGVGGAAAAGGGGTVGVFNFGSPTKVVTTTSNTNQFDAVAGYEDDDDAEGFVSTGGSYSPDFPLSCGNGGPLHQQQQQQQQQQLIQPANGGAGSAGRAIRQQSHDLTSSFVRSAGSNQPLSSTEGETQSGGRNGLRRVKSSKSSAKKTQQQQHHHNTTRRGELDRLETGSATSSHAVDGRQVQVLKSQARTAGRKSKAGKGGGSASRDTVVVPQNPREAALQQAAMDRYARDAAVSTSIQNTPQQLPSSGSGPHQQHQMLPASPSALLENMLPPAMNDVDDGTNAAAAADDANNAKISSWLQASSRASGGVRVREE